MSLASCVNHMTHSEYVKLSSCLLYPMCTCVLDSAIVLPSPVLEKRNVWVVDAKVSLSMWVCKWVCESVLPGRQASSSSPVLTWGNIRSWGLTAGFNNLASSKGRWRWGCTGVKPSQSVSQSHWSSWVMMSESIHSLSRLPQSWKKPLDSR